MYAIILAGGSGTRLWPLSRELFPKQFMPVPGSRLPGAHHGGRPADFSPGNHSTNFTQDDNCSSPHPGDSYPSSQAGGKPADPPGDSSSGFPPGSSPSNSPSPSRGEGRGGGEKGETTLFQATVERILPVVPAEKILVVTHTDQAGEIRRRLGLTGLDSVRLLEEPQARNTAPAIGLAARFLLHEAGPETVMAVLPSDHLIPEEDRFVELLKCGEAAAKTYGLVTFGIEPTYPETGYGYICRGKQLDQNTCRVEKFVEKPDLETARVYLEEGSYLWNSGMFVFRVGVLLEQYRRHLPEMHAALEEIDYENFSNLEEIYPRLEKISIDYGILEKAAEVAVIPARIKWSDIGSWEAYYQLSAKDKNRNALKGRVIPVDSENSLIISSSRLIGAVGLNELVVVETDDALLVCDRKRAQDVKKVVDRLSKEGAAEAREHRTVYRPWGSYTSLELGETYQVKRLNINPGSRLSLQSHCRRSEHWVVVRGEALVTIDDSKITYKKGECAFIPTGARHRIENSGSEPLAIIEVQNGDYLGEDDIVRYEDDYGRVEKQSQPGSKPPQDAPQSPPKNRDDSSASPARRRFEQWLDHRTLEPAMREELLKMKDDPEKIHSHFGSELTFGTGGMRGIVGPGLNRINCYIIRRATQGLADYINSAFDKNATQKVAIAYDTRRYSGEFAEAAALVLAANGIKALLFGDIRPTPILSFITRELGCAAGIVITASHNPPEYNGYKVYGPDGGQAVSPLVDDLIRAIEAVDMFQDVHTVSRDEAASAGLLEIIDPAFDRGYLEKVKSLSLSRPEKHLKVVFTPLHGTGAVFIPELLRGIDCTELVTVEEQMAPDPEFSTVRTPNPEEPAALEPALERAEREDANLVLATDPDCDRVGTAVRDNSGRFVILTGNQVGALLVEYICSRLTETGRMPEDPAMIKTVVTGNLGRKIAESYGLQVVETLTGFKFIGDKIKEFEARGTPHFVFGYEESVGYLAGTFVRDKDAVIATFLIAEMAAYYNDRGETLLDVLAVLQERHGYFSEDLFTIELKDVSEADRYVNAYKDLPADINGLRLVEKRDYDLQKGINLHTGDEFALTLPRSPVIHYTLDDGSWFAVRPSGTEPKIKIYISATAPTAGEADEKLARMREAVLNRD